MELLSAELVQLLGYSGQRLDIGPSVVIMKSGYEEILFVWRADLAVMDIEGSPLYLKLKAGILIINEWKDYGDKKD